MGWYFTPKSASSTSSARTKYESFERERCVKRDIPYTSDEYSGFMASSDPLVSFRLAASEGCALPLTTKQQWYQTPPPDSLVQGVWIRMQNHVPSLLQVLHHPAACVAWCALPQQCSARWCVSLHHWYHFSARYVTLVYGDAD